jgi:hypothetical protein
MSGTQTGTQDIDMAANYDLYDFRWGNGPMGTSPGVLTWSVDATIEASWIPPIADSFATWAKWTNVTFQQVAKAGNITFTEQFIDGPGKTLGNATVYADTRGHITAAAIKIDSGEDYHLVKGELIDTNVNKASRSFEAMVTHEIGHALGIDHIESSVALARMNPNINTYVASDLTKSDIDAIQSLYGVRAGSPAVTAETGLEQSDAVFRFYDTKSQDHFYTTGVTEKLNIMATLPHYKYEGVAWGVPHESSETIDVFRFYDHRSTEHFFTTSVEERDLVIKTQPTYQYEGVAFQAFADAHGEGRVTLDRFYNTESGVHHYSAGSGETEWIKAAGTGWLYEGHGFTVTAPTDYLLNI